MLYACRPHWTVARSMGENINSGSFLQKALEPVTYAIYIEHQSPFSFYYFSYLSTGVQMGGAWAPSRRTSFEPWPICLKFSTIIYYTHTRTVVKPDSPFLSPLIGKRDMPGMASEGEKVYLKCKYHHRTLLRGVADIYSRHRRPRLSTS